MYANNKEFLNPENYPKFIKNDLIVWKEIAINNTPDGLAKFYKHCYFLLLIHISILGSNPGGYMFHIFNKYQT